MTTRDEIRHIKKKVEMKLFSHPGVTGVDIGYKTVGGKKTSILAIIVYVANKHDVSPEEETLPIEIEGVPVDVVQKSYAIF